MERREFVKCLGVAGAMASLGPGRDAFAAASDAPIGKNRPIRVLHITDMHIRPEYDAPQRCVKLVKKVREQAGKVDFILNGGDSIYAADYDDIKRDRVLAQWKLWDEIVAGGFAGIEMISCIGNHDSWWAAPDEDDPLRGKDYVTKKLNMPGRYYARDKGAWKILVLDGNNEGLFDDEQMRWLKNQIDSLKPQQPALFLSHQPVLDYGNFWKEMGEAQKQLVESVRGLPNRFCFVSGHTHNLSSVKFHNLSFLCNGAFSGFWWEPGRANDGSHNGTPMGYALLELFPDGRVTCQYTPITDL